VRVEITVVSVVVTFVRVKNTLRVEKALLLEITLCVWKLHTCVWKSHYACEHNTMRVDAPVSVSSENLHAKISPLIICGNDDCCKTCTSSYTMPPYKKIFRPIEGFNLKPRFLTGPFPKFQKENKIGWISLIDVVDINLNFKMFTLKITFLLIKSRNSSKT
jgi:hypothetical protein